MTEMNPLPVELKGVSRKYRHFALEEIDLELEQGTIMGFIGPNGAGKSTTIRILMGLVRRDSGTVNVLGYSMPSHEIEAKREIGFVSEDLRLYGTASIGWHMNFVSSIYPRWDQKYAEHLCRRFDIKPEQRVKGLSHGQRVKAALMLVLARRPRLLILDEPTTGLDPVARYEVLGELMKVLADEDRTILFSSHNTLDVEQISDSITFIDRGRIIDSGDKEGYLDRWRRMRLEVPPGVKLPSLPGTVAADHTGRIAVVTTSNFDPAMTTLYSDAGATMQSIDRMTLEEIFVQNVERRRERLIA
jgi:ABC-2 type transport system ATP-binding protein